MTIAVACNLADGVVMGSDSAVTIQGTITTPDGMQESGILKVYNDAEKLFPLHEKLPIGITSYGVSLLENRTIQSYIREFKLHHKEEEVSLWNLELLAEELWRFFRDKYLTVYKSVLEEQNDQTFDEIGLTMRPSLGLMVGGFSPGEYLSEIWEVIVQSQNKEDGVHNIRPRGVFGSDWRGQTEGIRRFHKGFSVSHLNAIVDAILEYHDVEMSLELQQQIYAIIQKAEYIIPWNGMPLQEGIDYVKFCLNIMINQTRYVIGAPTCGGNVRIAVIKHGEQIEFVTDTEFEVRRF